MGTLETCPHDLGDGSDSTQNPGLRMHSSARENFARAERLFSFDHLTVSGLRVGASPSPGTSNPSGRQPVESSYIRWACLQHPGRGIFRPGFSGPADTPDGSQHRGDLRPPFKWTVVASPRLPARERPLTPAGTTVRSVG